MQEGRVRRRLSAGWLCTVYGSVVLHGMLSSHCMKQVAQAFGRAVLGVEEARGELAIMPRYQSRLYAALLSKPLHEPFDVRIHVG